MAPTKRPWPAFSPPRPGKTKGAAGLGTAIKSAGKRNSSKQPKKTQVQGAINKPRRRSKLVSPTPSASDSQGGSHDDDHDNDNGDEDDDEAMNDDDVDSESHDKDDDHDDDDPQRDMEDSPEPDYVLAEIVDERGGAESSQPGKEDAPIPHGLVHRILDAQFQHGGTDKDKSKSKSKTKISTDARELVSKYIEIFVREAVMRCAYEKTDRDRHSGGDAELVVGDGFLDVEDLEKAAVQLCLDF